MDEESHIQKFGVEVRARRRSDGESVESEREAIEAEIPANSEIPEIIGKALVDQQFREQLFEDKSGVLAAYNLNDAETAVIHNLKREDIDRHIEGLGGSVAWKIAVEITKSF